MSIENCDPIGKRNLAHTLTEDFAFQLHGAEHDLVLDVQFQVGMFDRVGKRRSVELLRRLCCEFDQLVVLVERERHVAGIWQGQADFFFCQHCANQDAAIKPYARSHRAPPFFSRWKLTAAAGAWFSPVSWETRNIDGPNAGN